MESMGISGTKAQLFPRQICNSLSRGDTRGLLEKYPTFGREKETGLLGALDA